MTSAWDFAMDDGGIFNAAFVRRLDAATDQATFQMAEKVAQVFSGVFFTGLAMWLTFTNGTRLSYIQQAALEKRLAVCCGICTYIACFSSFFNFFQLTEVQKFALPRQTNYTLDLARPIEWICTCPLLQLALVLMGGSRIPEWRRVAMPGLALAILVSGLVSQLIPAPYLYVAFIIGMLFAFVMWWLMRQQILEHSDGQECLTYGDSEFRKATILVIATWFPFPIWFFLTPEGLGIIDNIVVVQVGWGFLNIVAKFSFIFYIQRIKDNYCNRLKARRELFGATGVNGGKALPGTATPGGVRGSAAATKAANELSAVAVETMTFLGMAQHAERLLRLLQKAEVTSLEQMEPWTKEKCESLNLPWDLISAMQKRFRVWKLEMQDNTELALEKGEEAYGKDEPHEMMSVVASKLEPYAQQQVFDNTPRSGNMTPPGFPMQTMQRVPSGNAQELLMTVGAEVGDRVARVEDTLGGLHEKMDSLANATFRHQADLEANMGRRIEQAVMQALQVARRAQETEVEGGLKQRMEELVTGAQGRIESHVERLLQGLQDQVRELQAAQGRTSEMQKSVQAQSENSLARRLESEIGRVREEVAKVSEGTRSALEAVAREIFSKAENQNLTTSRRLDEVERSVGRKMEEATSKAADRTERAVETLRTTLQADSATTMSRADLLSESIREQAHSSKEGVADLRRMVMMVLEQLSTTQERTQGNAGQLMELRGALDAGVDRIVSIVTDMPQKTFNQNMLPDMGGGSTAGRPAQMNSREMYTTRSLEQATTSRGMAGKFGMQVAGS